MSPAPGGTARRPPADVRGVVIGRVAGAPVVVARSWLVVAAVVVLLFGPQLEPRLGALAYVVAAGYAVLLLLSVLVHETAHAWAARAVGTPASAVVLDLWGGHTRFDAEAPTPGRSAAVAVVGPLANAVLAVLGAALTPLLDPGGVAGRLAWGLAVTNAFVALFNLLPALPLDGGRLLEAAVWRLRGSRAEGTLAGGWAGRALAVLVVAWVLVRPLATGQQPDLVVVAWGCLVAAFLWAGAGSAIQVGRLRRRTPGLSVQRLMRPAVGAPAGAALAEVVDRAAREGAHEVVLVDDAGAPVAVVDRAALGSVPVERRGQTAASAVARALPAHAVVRDDLVGEPVLALLLDHPAAEYAVLDAGGRVVGVLVGSAVVAEVSHRR